MFLENVGFDPASYGTTNGTESAAAGGARATSGSGSTAQGGSATQSTAKDVAELGRNDFLRLLVSQLENQDPLQPAKDTEFVAQLATFSSLEQLIDMNERMDSVISGQQELVNSQALDLVGKEVLLDTGGTLQLEGGRAETVVFDLAEKPSEARLDIYDEGGSLVRSLELESLRSGRHQVKWDGLDEDGDALPAGTYRAEVVLGNEEVGERTVMPFVSMPVEGLHVGPDGMALSSDARVIGLDQVLEIRAKSES
jgi:flagellar basal-body rod modification protein FlgD